MKPQIDKSSFVAKGAIIIGEVNIGKNCSIFPNVVIRGDQNAIKMDNGSNIQDCAVVHTDGHLIVSIGKNVSIGHSAVIHGATIEDNVIIGMNATVMNGCKIGKGSIIGANALVTENKEIPKNSLVIGVPGKVIKQDEKFEELCIKNAETYIRLTKEHLENEHEYYVGQD